VRCLSPVLRPHTLQVKLLSESSHKWLMYLQEQQQHQVWKQECCVE
jgi:hypothetical protein